MADKRISQLIERVTIANNDVLPIVASGATTTNKVTVSTLQDWMQNNLDVGVTSIGITIGSSGTDINVTGSPVTTSGNITINIPTASATNRGLLSSSDWTTFNNKLSSVGLSMPSAFTVSNSPLTANGTITVTGAGTVAQYIRGDGSLADFPEAGGGGASVSYYLNGSVSQGTIGGIAYREMNKTPILGAGTDFTIAADGYIASFITDAGDPSLLEIPGGNWNFESYFQASSGGGSPSFYIELYKVNSGGTATLIASNSANPELIAFGTTTTAYFSTLAVPTTTLALTDRLAVRFYVTHSGRTITMHTENSNLCQVITTFTTGLTALNGLTAQVQNFATGTSGTDFAISSAGSTHTFNLPDASASARGVVTTGSQVFGGVKTFANGLSLSAVGGSNQTTRIVNIGTLHEGTASVNQIGFNSGNNIYFGKGLNNGGVISWNNAAVRYYTLPDADGTIALTSQIPANPVGGTGTTNQIPKFSATSTLTNSNISDNGSDVVISSRTGISLSGQSILITPNLGGTTNRIETTGSLPLAIATSGSSITLAAGGTTPQITLASTGAVTLTGALNGTSASFTSSGISVPLEVRSTTSNFGRIRVSSTTSTAGNYRGYEFSNGSTFRGGIVQDESTEAISIFTPIGGQSFTLSSTGAATFTGEVITNNGTNSTNGIKVISSLSSSLFTGGIEFIRTTVAAGSKIEPVRDAALGGVGLKFMTTANNAAESSGTYSTPLTLAPTGAATFSSSVTATSFNLGNGQFLRLTRSSGGLQYDALGIVAGTDNTRLISTGDFDVVNGALSSQFKISSTGAATFSSSVNLGTNANSADTALLNIKQSGTSYNNGIYIERGGERNGYHMYIGGALDSLTFRRNYFGTQSDVMSLTRDGNVGIGTTSPEELLDIRGANRDETSAQYNQVIYSTSTHGMNRGGSIGLGGTTNGTSSITAFGAIKGGKENDTAGNTAGVLSFLTRVNAGPITEKMRITSGGDLLIGATSSISSGRRELVIRGANGSLLSLGNSTTADRFQIASDSGENALINNKANTPMILYTNDTERMRITSGGVLQMSNNATTFSIGSISGQNRIQWDSTEFSFLNTANSYTALGASAFNTRSDYRLKENVAPVQDALSKITSLKPCTFNFIAEPEKEVVGFIAHEVQEIFPQAISGEKDGFRIEQVEVSPAELDEEGNVITEAVIEEKEVPVYQGIDQSKLVPLLVAAIQEQQEQIKSLTEQVEALKSQING